MTVTKGYLNSLFGDKKIPEELIEKIIYFRDLSYLSHSLRKKNLRDSDVGDFFTNAMDDDFNTPKALSYLFDHVKEINIAVKQMELGGAMELARQLKELGSILGILQQNPGTFLQGESKEGEITPEQIEAMIQQRADAKKAKDFAAADQIREDLAAQGIILKDSREGTTWFREG